MAGIVQSVMSITLQGREYEEIHDQIYGYWEDLAGDDGADSLEELYERGVPRRDEDEFLWDLAMNNKHIYTRDEIDELERNVNLVKNNDYPDDLKKAVSDLLNLLKNDVKYKFKNVINAKAKNAYVRRAYEIRTGHGAAPGQGPANRIRNFLGVHPPKGAEGGKRSRKARKTRKQRKAKKTRKH